MSARVSPTDRIRGEIAALFDGSREIAEIIEDVARLGARLIIQTAVEADQGANPPAPGFHRYGVIPPIVSEAGGIAHLGETRMHPRRFQAWEVAGRFPHHRGYRSTDVPPGSGAEVTSSPGSRIGLPVMISISASNAPARTE